MSNETDPRISFGVDVEWDARRVDVAAMREINNIQGACMEFGIYHEFPSLDGHPDSDAFDEAFAMVDAAEEWGLDVMWLAELHFDPARSVLSAPLCVASAIAARTRQITIAIALS